MNLAAVYHEAKSKYAYAYDRDTLHFRVRTERGDIDHITLVGGDPFRWLQSKIDPSKWEWDKSAAFFENMQLEYQTDLYDYWFVAIKPQWKRIRYAFILQKGETEILFGSRDFYDLTEKPDYRFKVSLYFNFPYINFEDIFTAPAWVKDIIWYQIFPERFANGDPKNNPVEALPWGSEENENIHMFFGGDLQGIIDHLDELVDLGINGIYLTPIFESPSSHKYDTSDYYKIDPHFGTNELFGELVSLAHQRGIRIMLDAVFNHCGWFHPWWQDVVKNGSESQYYDCFLIQREPVVNFPVSEGQMPVTTPEQRNALNYSTFAFVPNMPKWNTDHPLVKEHLLGAIRYWMEIFGVDAWRLDVSNEVSHDFWRAFRSLVKEINPDAFILGENWDNSYPWLQGDQFDAVMNYELTYPIWNMLGQGESIYEPYNVGQFHDAINKLLAGYPKHNLEFMYNMVDSHDTPRILSICADSVEKTKQAYVLEMTFTGAPSVFYGSEIGLAGPEGHNRRCMPWNKQEWNLELRDLLKQLIRLRKAHPAFKAVDLHWLVVSDAPQYFIFSKQSAGETIYVLINHEHASLEISLPEIMQAGNLIDLITGEQIADQKKVSLTGDGFMILHQEDSIQTNQ